jgi:peptidoglycan/LPS O-acetylase OafA/YrhL
VCSLLAEPRFLRKSHESGGGFEDVQLGKRAIIVLLMGMSFSICEEPGDAARRASYGGYLFHLPVLMVFSPVISLVYPSLPGWSLLFAIVLLAALFLASVSFAYFEQRFLQMRLRYG